MKLSIFSIVFFLSLSSFAQFDKPFILSATSNFNFKTNGLATNDAGLGLSFDAFFFSKNKLQLLIETSADWFIGDKFLITDANGRNAKGAVIYSIKAGPQFFIIERLALSVTYGPAWHRIRDFEFTTNYGFKYAVTGFLTEKKRFATKLFLVAIPKKDLNIKYFGLSLGYRFL
jgi:hypothetical protein